jgi:hypothetical protein
MWGGLCVRRVGPERLPGRIRGQASVGRRSSVAQRFLASIGQHKCTTESPNVTPIKPFHNAADTGLPDQNVPSRGSRAGCAPHRGTSRVSMLARGWAATLAHRSRRGGRPDGPTRPYPQVDSRRTRDPKQVVDISLTVADTDKVGLGTVFMDSNHRLQTLEPLVTFLRLDGAAFVGDSATYPSRVTGPDFLCD